MSVLSKLLGKEEEPSMMMGDDSHKEMKIKMLDDLIDKLMGMGSDESAADDDMAQDKEEADEPISDMLSESPKDEMQEDAKGNGESAEPKAKMMALEISDKDPKKKGLFA